MSENDSVKRKSSNSKKKIKKRNKKKIILISIISILAVVAILIATGWGYYNHIRNKIYVEYKPENKNETSYNEVDGITNVLLIGTDGRTLDEPARSDSIIVATLDNNNKKVKLTSIMRDTVVNIPEYGENKINAAFAFGSSEEDENGKLKGAEGGAALVMETIEENFNLHLDKYIIVNFWGFEAIIDEIGGIEVDIKDYEIDEVNKYIGESTGVNSPPITETGLQKVNGQQALSYARIRYVGNGDFERGQRQSKVLHEVAKNLKEVNPLKYVSIANTLSEHVKTNIDIPEALNLAYTIYKLPSLDFEQLQIPQTELIARDNLYKDRGWCLLIDLEQNSKVLHDFIFNNKLPNPEEFDLLSVENVAAAYNAEEARYNSLYNIKPEEYNDKNTDAIPEPTPDRDVVKPPASGGTTNPPTGGTSNPPASGGNGTTNPPANGGNETTKPPVNGGNETTNPPASGGNETTPPANGENNPEKPQGEKPNQ
ncbi:LCP family protein [Clostridium sp. DSM 100503]|uniref:LCP family glycopolymer transferase n=1 Tax=Clostridium sp. DSM 100503 TaxID=2963282 RepID=UPI00214A5B5D|nr:LCP family protein [Clostridium sp. DSM 100503]MCR1952564.1 LCP family protein [Clostridium sp. DSM 100503]